jgi:hypothetical protein
MNLTLPALIQTETAVPPPHARSAQVIGVTTFLTTTTTTVIRAAGQIAQSVRVTTVLAVAVVRHQVTHLRVAVPDQEAETKHELI